MISGRHSSAKETSLKHFKETEIFMPVSFMLMEELLVTPAEGSEEGHSTAVFLLEVTKYEPEFLILCHI